MLRNVLSVICLLCFTHPVCAQDRAPSTPEILLKGLDSSPDAIEVVERSLAALGGRAKIAASKALRVDVTSDLSSTQIHHRTSDWSTNLFLTDSKSERVSNPVDNRLATTSGAGHVGLHHQSDGSVQPDAVRELALESPAHALLLSVDRKLCRMRFSSSPERGLPAVFNDQAQQLVWFNCPSAHQSREVWLWAFSKTTWLPTAVWVPGSGAPGARMSDILLYKSSVTVNGIVTPTAIVRQSSFARAENISLANLVFLPYLPEKSK